MESVEEVRSWLSQRNGDLHHRSVVAKRETSMSSKRRRDDRRYVACRDMSIRVHDIKAGKYLSWGYGSSAGDFDEYFGEMNALNQPHGIGVKYYSDGTIYRGKFQNGQLYANEESTYVRPTGLSYTGGWVNGKKHGYGKLTYPDTVADKEYYEGQWANNLQHGQGILRYNDGSVYKGRFRFGVRDGPGALTDATGAAVKGNFKDSPIDAYLDNPPPRVFEDDFPSRGVVNPFSLLEYASKAFADHALRTPRPPAVDPTIAHQKMRFVIERMPHTSPHIAMLKRLMAIDFYSAANSLQRSTTARISSFQEALSSGMHVFDEAETVTISGARLSKADLSALVYFQGGNIELSTLALVGCGLRETQLQDLGKELHRWSRLTSLNLSYNSIKSVSAVLGTVPPSLKSLLLAGCGLSTECITTLLESTQTKLCSLNELDLSFNAVGVVGAQAIAKCLSSGSCYLTVLHLRSSEIMQAGAECIATALKGNCQLKVLTISDNNVKASTIVDIAARLKGSFTEFETSFSIGQTEMPKRYRVIHS